MCGIVAGSTRRDISKILIEGLKRLEYRGYDSAGIAISNEEGLNCYCTVGKVANLEKLIQSKTIKGSTGIAHTRWATHGIPHKRNAHPLVSQGEIAIVHNGIVDNYEKIKSDLIAFGYQFNSETDTECVVHYFHYLLKKNPDPILATST